MEAYLMYLAAWHWVSLGAVFLILELFLGANFFLVWLAVSAFITALLGVLPSHLTWQTQVLVFALISGVSVALWSIYLKKHPLKHPKTTLNRRANRYIGTVVTLETAMINGRGKIRLEDSWWSIEGDDLAVGDKVQVIGTHGTVLKVKAYE
jgi:membrane protein implicated in regulation of membrane protease activity